MSITNIDFHVDDHLIQVGQGEMRIFQNGDMRKELIIFYSDDIERILRIANEQLIGHKE